MRTIAAAVVIAVLAAGALPAADLLIEVVAEGVDGDERQADVTLRTVAEGQDRQLTISVNSEAIVDVPSGVVWSVGARAEGFWSRPESLFVPESGAQVSLRLLRTGKVTGSVSHDPGDEPPRAISLRFSPLSSNPSAGDEVECTIEQGRFSCDLPHGAWDVRARAKSFVSAFFWGVAIEAGGKVDLGPIKLKRGASVVGAVATSEGPGVGRTCTIQLVPQAGALADADRERQKTAALSTTPDSRGFFHFAGVLPGRYLLTADQPGYAQSRVFPVDVYENAETALMHGLVLDRPVTFSIDLNPPEDPFGRPWELTLVEESGHRAVRTTTVSRTPAEGGILDVENLRPGRYTARVFDSQGSTWAVAEIELQPSQPHLALEIAMVEVEGEVLLGDEGLAAEVTFESTGGPLEHATSISLYSDADGVVTGVLPGEGTYEAVVKSSVPELRKRVRQVEVEQVSGSTVARFTIRLSEIEVPGVVVDTDDVPVSGATVRALSAENLRDETAITTDEDGEFRLRALERGSYTVFAQDGERRSKEALVTLGAADPAPLRLVLQASDEVSGRVIDPGGVGVPGANILVGGAGFTSGGQITSGIDGRFTLQVPGAALSLMFLIQAPGYGLHAERRLVEGGKDETFPLSQVGSSLTMTGLIVLREGGGTAFLLRDGAILADGILRTWASLNGAPPSDPDRLHVPMLEPGAYQVCGAGMNTLRALLETARPDPGLRCVDTYLQPGLNPTVEVPH